MQSISRLGVYGIAIVDRKVILTTKERGPFKRLLDLPGGAIEFGESPEQALRREFLEEVALTFTTLSLIDNLSHTGQYLRDGKEYAFHHIGLIYRVASPTAAAGYIAQDPHDWYDIDSLTPSQLSPFAQTVLQQFPLNGCNGS